MRPLLLQKYGFEKLAVNYEEMFNPLIKLAPAVASTVKQRIQWAKTTLKRQDRIIWYLRWVRIEIASKAAQNGGSNKEPLEALSAKYLKEAAAKTGQDEMKVLGQAQGWQTIQNILAHFYSLEIPAIDNFTPGFESPTQLREKFQGMEDDATEEAGDSDHLIEPEADDEIVLDLGGGWAWWKLPRAYCSEESRAMGHCGNAPEQGRSDREILSLRQRKKVGKQEYWEPHLTFILKSGNILGEMKGRNNDKPVERYHPAIMALLSQPWIKGIDGGGYLPEHNFQWDDLSNDEQKKVMEANPGLSPYPFSGWYKNKKLSKDDIDRIENEMELTYEESIKGFFAEKWNDTLDMLSNIGDDEVRTKAREIEDATGAYTNLLDQAFAYVDDGSRVLANVVRSLVNEYPILEARAHEVNIKDGKSVIAFVKSVANEYPDSHTLAVIYSSAQVDEDVLDTQISEAYQNMSGSLGLSQANDKKWYLYMSIDEAIENINEGNTNPEYQEWPTIEMAEGLFGVESIEEAFAHPLPAPKREDQPQLYKEPESDEEAQREGIKVSRKKALFLRRLK